jgi:transcriptional regulator GlxA family with amidase domain
VKPRRIGFVGYEGVTALDLVGPSEAFGAAWIEDGGALRRAYEIVILSPNGRPFAAESGVVFRPHASLEKAPRLDTLIVPGGVGLREPRTNARIGAWLERRAPRTRRVATVCTGIYGLAPTGLLDGRRVTTHWRFARDVAERFPALRMDPNALFLRDGRYYTSAGVTAGIDLALALVEEDHGPQVALQVARELVVYLKRSGGQEQYSEPLQFQVESRDRLGELGTWIPGHLREDLTVEALAARACLCPRQFTRRFQAIYRRTPAAFVEDLRLGEARRRLAAPGVSVEAVSASVGFKSADAFRRAFERRYGVSPSNYRGRFAPPGVSDRRSTPSG